MRPRKGGLVRFSILLKGWIQKRVGQIQGLGQAYKQGEQGSNVAREAAI